MMSEPADDVPGECKHTFAFRETTRWTDYAAYNTRFVRIDRYYCVGCLTEREVKKEATTRDTPDWYR